MGREKKFFFLLKDKLRNIKICKFIWVKIDSSQAVSSLVDRKELWGAVQMKDFYNQKGVGRNKEFILGKKVGYYKLTFL